jgi:chromosome segregation protein
LFLKKIEIRGFKSFADKVEFELEKGITGVVGPNGSGKSNISDAVRWVLGEQSAKSLRGSKMEDVIFAGTHLRKPLGFAEVSIIIDNTDGMLPVDYTEVIITRRMYRSGESEYYINKTSCRMKDITELFMDTGVGRDGYSIISQGRVEEIINAKPEDRREIFEEAAGITKYKTRKIESEKKLYNTEQNILRINDIVNELGNQIDPLYEESIKAKKYLSLKERLKVLEINTFIRNIDSLKDKLSDLDELYRQLKEELEANSKSNEEIEENYNKLKQDISNIDGNIESIQAKIYTTENEMEKSVGEINVINEKINNLDKNIKRINEEIEENENHLKKLKATILENKKVIDDNNTELDKLKLDLNQKNTEFENISGSISQKDAHVEDLKTEVIEILNSIAERKSAINGYNTYKSGIEKRREQIKREKLQNKEKANELNLETANIEKEVEEQKKICGSNIKKIEALENAKTGLIESKESNEKAIFKLNGKMQTKSGLYKVLRNMENEFEGYNRSVREIMKQKGRSDNFSKGICGVVADIISVDEKYETAIEVALGGALQNIVTEDEFAAKKCIEYLKTNRFGRATFLPLTTISPRNYSANIKRVINKKGYIDLANNLVHYDNKYINIVSSLLGRVIVVDNIDNGMIIAKEINYSYKIVTTDGDIINPGGAFTGGSINEKTGRILSRKREIDELLIDIKGLKESINEYEAKNKDIEKELDSVKLRLTTSFEERHTSDLKLSSLEGSMSSYKKDIERMSLEEKSLIKEIEQLEEEYKEANIKLEQEISLLANLEDKSGKVSKEAEEEQLKIKDISDKRDALSDEITSLRVKITEHKHNIKEFENRNIEVNKNILELDELNCKKDNEKKTSIIEKEKLHVNINNINESDILLKQKNVSSKSKLEDLFIEKKKNSMLLEEIEKRKKEYGEAYQNLQSEVHKLEMQKARIDMEIENMQNKIWDEYELSYASAIKYRIEVNSMSQASKEINNIKSNIKELGIINVNAIEEYEKVKERFEFLTTQKNDLEEAKESLNKVILEMTEKMETQFSKNFEIINQNFNEVFAELFGGGKANLILCDDDDVLSSGIEIIAEPPGKKLQYLTLLSGGEKALTAIALLFAILRMKPSPFCILDEIEAALDDVNVARFANFLRELSKETQFIVVTHRKGTMEVADALYGVTMEEKGVSKLVSAKLTEKVS